MSKPKPQKTRRAVSPVANPCSAVVAVANEIARIQCRQRAINARLSVLSNESVKLSIEREGLEHRKLELHREFDRAAK